MDMQPQCLWLEDAHWPVSLTKKKKSMSQESKGERKRNKSIIGFLFPFAQTQVSIHVDTHRHSTAHQNQLSL